MVVESNNLTKPMAYVCLFRMATKNGLFSFEVFGDSMHVIGHLNG